MAHRHFYLGIENLALTPPQKAILVAELRALGATYPCSPSVACVNHWRTRLDGEAVIFEALFDEDNLTVVKFKQRLGAIFGADPDTIDHVTVIRSFAGGSTPVVTFSRGGTDYLRFALFGGQGASWTASGDECRGYLALYRDEWDPEL